MAIPELVIADAPYKVYPGGLIAVRCSDWLATSGATSESDALSTTGDAVRETQQVNNINANPGTAFAAADDTLELTGLPLLDSTQYRVYFSYRLEGELDLTPSTQLRLCYNFAWVDAAIIGLTSAGVVSNTWFNQQFLSPRAFYAFSILGNVTINDPSEPIFIRAFSETGTTIEILLDQIVFLPVTFYSAALSGYDGETRALATPDGADGGDANGEFTRFFGSVDNPNAADYQVKDDESDAEWMIRETPADFDPFYNFDTGNALSAHLYTSHGVNWLGSGTWSQDTFDNRTTSPGQAMGQSPEGYGYDIDTSGVPTNPHCYVDSGVNKIRLFNRGALAQWAFGEGSPPFLFPNAALNQGLAMQFLDQWEWYLNFTYVSGTFASAGRIRIYPQTNLATPTFPRLIISPVAQIWQLLDVPAANAGTHSIAWFSPGAVVGVRWEFQRYVARVRLWDASGAEPSTWDEEFFLRDGPIDYDYSDDQVRAYHNNDAYRFLLFRVEHGSVVGGTTTINIDVNENTVTHDPYGDTPTDMTAYLESPEGTFIGELDVPWGAEYLVYWGKRIWTEYDVDNEEHYLSLSMKVWNHEGAPEHQRAQLGDLRFLFVPLNIIPMNWRRASRKSTAHRILMPD